MGTKKRDYIYTEKHLDFCVNDRQRKLIHLLIQVPQLSTPEIVEAMGIADPSSIFAMAKRIREQAARHNYNPDSDNILEKQPTDLPIKGVSTFWGYERDKNGQKISDELVVKAGWSKSNATAEEIIASAQNIAAAMKEDIEPAKPIDWTQYATFASPHVVDQLLNSHILTDFHLAMLAWGEETHDDNWKTEIAEEFLIAWFTHSLRIAPEAGVGFLMQLGDFTHFDGTLPVTVASGHILDTDTRMRLMQRVAIRVLRRVIAMMLGKYKKVIISMTAGNHDPSTAGWLTEMFDAFYSDEPRLEVVTHPGNFHAIQHGKTMIGWTHGHAKQFGQMDQVLAGMYPEIFGATKFRYAHSGHLHSKDRKESPLMQSEQHETMTPKDAYAAGHGYLSQRAANVITYHKEYGEVGRQRMTPEMIKALSE